MKTYYELWNNLINKVDSGKLSTIQRDWTEGKVPDLPFFIVNQQEVKSHIQNKLMNIDGQRMETTIIQAQYGDGKTNIFKYLELYFKNYKDNNIYFIYCRANPDQTDLCMFLMQHLQVSCFELLKNQIKELSSIKDFDYADLACQFEADFSFIKEYTKALFNPENTDDTLENLIFLGTGRLYSQAMFAKYNLVKLTDFNRREIFVLFMNILASAGVHVVFAIDELEKIHDKSAKRMAHFFTSYRELLDLFNKIRGHYIITAITNSVNIESLSQPFFERVSKDIIKIETLKEENDIRDLVNLMSNLLGKKVELKQMTTLLGKIKRKKTELNNRRLVQFISESLKSLGQDIKTETLIDALKQNDTIYSLFIETKTRIENEDGFSNLSRAFFDPLEYYLTALGYNMNNNSYRRTYQAVVDDDTHRAFFFLFNDSSKIKERLIYFFEEKNISEFVVFVPENLDVNYAQLEISGADISIVDYEPENLFVLLNMYRWNFDKQKGISKFLSLATKNTFD